MPKVNSNFKINNSETVRFSEHPYLPFVYRFNDNRLYCQYCSITGTFERISYFTNNYGRLGNDYSFAKDTNEYRILVLGGSTSFLPGIRFGEISNISDTWPAILEKKLNSNFANKKYRVINLSIEGHSSECSLISLVTIGIHLNPDLVISYDGINDMAHFFDYEINYDFSDFVKKFNISEVKSIKSFAPDFLNKSITINILLQKIDNILGFKKTQNIIFNTVNPKRRLNYWYSNSLKNIHVLEKNLYLMNKICNSYDIKFVCCTMHYLKNNLITFMFNKALREFFYNNNIDYFDSDHFTPHNEESFKIDDVHFSRKGTESFADGIYKKLIMLIDK